jgi:hypothetical protein
LVDLNRVAQTRRGSTCRTQTIVIRRAARAPTWGVFGAFGLSPAVPTNPKNPATYGNSTLRGPTKDTPEPLVMMGSGVRVPPSAWGEKPDEYGHFGVRAARLGVAARVELASRLSIPVQRLELGGHTISSGDGVNSPRAAMPNRPTSVATKNHPDVGDPETPYASARIRTPGRPRPCGPRHRGRGSGSYG